VRAVITEAELKRLAPASRVLVPRGAIVTPAARDYAKDNGIALVGTTGEGVFGVADAGMEVGVRRNSKMNAGLLEAQWQWRPDADVHEVMERILRAAAAKLGPHATRETLGRVLIAVLLRLGYAVGVSGGLSGITSQDR